MDKLIPNRIIATCFILFFSLQVFGQQTQLDQELKAIMEQYQAVGVSVAVVKDGQPIYKGSLGYRDKARGELLENDDVFRIASISKSFVATGLLQLVEAGRMSLDDDVGELIGFAVRNPNHPDKKITLRMILSHTSSINDKNGYFTLDTFQPEKNPDWAKSYNEYAPGEEYQYCNLNFNLAGAILEKFSGQRFDYYINEKILEPLGLYGGYNVDLLDSTRLVTLYEYDKTLDDFKPANAYVPIGHRIEQYTLGYSTPVFSPTGGMKISAADLARYMTMHMNYGTIDGVTIISEESAKAMQTKLSEEEGYGLALRTISNLIEGKTLKGHNGVAYGLYSTMFFEPEEKFGIVVITNGCNTGYTDGVNDFLKACVNSLYRHLILP